MPSADSTLHKLFFHLCSVICDTLSTCLLLKCAHYFSRNILGQFEASVNVNWRDRSQKYHAVFLNNFPELNWPNQIPNHDLLQWCLQFQNDNDWTDFQLYYPASAALREICLALRPGLDSDPGSEKSALSQNHDHSPPRASRSEWAISYGAKSFH